jgi:hypothetical protein
LVYAVTRAASATKARAASARFDRLLLDTVPEEGDERELEHHFRDALRMA